MRIPRKYDPSSGLRPDRNARSVNPGADRGSAAPNICKASPGTPEGRQQQRTVGQLPLFGRSKADCRPTEIAGKRLDIDGTWTVGEADRNVSGAVGNSDMERIIAYDGSSDRIICDFGIRQTTVNNRPPHQKLFAAGSRLQRRSQPKIPFGNQPQQPFPGQNLFDTKDIIHADGL